MVRRRLGVYEVPSQTAPGVVYVVRGTGPLLDGYACSCPAAGFGHVCAHVAAVHLARLRRTRCGSGAGSNGVGSVGRRRDREGHRLCSVKQMSSTYALDDARWRALNRRLLDQGHRHREAGDLVRARLAYYGFVQEGLARLRVKGGSLSARLRRRAPGVRLRPYGRRPLPADHSWAFQRATSASRQASEQ